MPTDNETKERAASMTPEQFWPKFENKFPCNYSPGQFRDIMDFARAFALSETEALRKRLEQYETDGKCDSCEDWKAIADSRRQKRLRAECERDEALRRVRELEGKYENRL